MRGALQIEEAEFSGGTSPPSPRTGMMMMEMDSTVKGPFSGEGSISKSCVCTRPRECPSAAPPICAGEAAFVICPERGSSYFCGEIRRGKGRQRGRGWEGKRSLGREEAGRSEEVYLQSGIGPLFCCGLAPPPLLRCRVSLARLEEALPLRFFFSPRPSTHVAAPAARSMSPMRLGTGTAAGQFFPVSNYHQ